MIKSFLLLIILSALPAKATLSASDAERQFQNLKLNYSNAVEIYHSSLDHQIKKISDFNINLKKTNITSTTELYTLYEDTIVSLAQLNGKVFSNLQNLALATQKTTDFIESSETPESLKLEALKFLNEKEQIIQMNLASAKTYSNLTLGFTDYWKTNLTFDLMGKSKESISIMRRFVFLMGGATAVLGVGHSYLTGTKEGLIYSGVSILACFVTSIHQIYLNRYSKTNLSDAEIQETTDQIIKDIPKIWAENFAIGFNQRAFDVTKIQDLVSQILDSLDCQKKLVKPGNKS